MRNALRTRRSPDTLRCHPQSNRSCSYGAPVLASHRQAGVSHHSRIITRSQLRYAAGAVNFNRYEAKKEALHGNNVNDLRDQPKSGLGLRLRLTQPFLHSATPRLRLFLKQNPNETLPLEIEPKRAFLQECNGESGHQRSNALLCTSYPTRTATARGTVRGNKHKQSPDCKLLALNNNEFRTNPLLSHPQRAGKPRRQDEFKVRTASLLQVRGNAQPSEEVHNIDWPAVADLPTRNIGSARKEHPPPRNTTPANFESSSCARVLPFVETAIVGKKANRDCALEHTTPSLDNTDSTRSPQWHEFLFSPNNPRSSRKLFPAKSKIHGTGLYASKSIRSGVFVGEFLGERIRLSVADVREDAYWSRGMKGTYMFGVGPSAILDGTVRGGVMRFINHSCSPNVYARKIRAGKGVGFFTKQTVRRGEELTFDYRFKQEGPDMKVECLCGSKNCRRFLN